MLSESCVGSMEYLESAEDSVKHFQPAQKAHGIAQYGHSLCRRCQAQANINVGGSWMIFMNHLLTLVRALTETGKYLSSAAADTLADVERNCKTLW